MDGPTEREHPDETPNELDEESLERAIDKSLRIWKTSLGHPDFVNTRSEVK
jgi:hypothetical protein